MKTFQEFRPYCSHSQSKAYACYDGYKHGYEESCREWEEKIKQIKEVARQKNKLIKKLEQQIKSLEHKLKPTWMR